MVTGSDTSLLPNLVTLFLHNESMPPPPPHHHLSLSRQSQSCNTDHCSLNNLLLSLTLTCFVFLRCLQFSQYESFHLFSKLPVSANTFFITKMLLISQSFFKLGRFRSTKQCIAVYPKEPKFCQST